MGAVPQPCCDYDMTISFLGHPICCELQSFKTPWANHSYILSSEVFEISVPKVKGTCQSVPRTPLLCCPWAPVYRNLFLLMTSSATGLIVIQRHTFYSTALHSEMILQAGGAGTQHVLCFCRLTPNRRLSDSALIPALSCSCVSAWTCVRKKQSCG